MYNICVNLVRLDRFKYLCALLFVRRRNGDVNPILPRYLFDKRRYLELVVRVSFKMLYQTRRDQSFTMLKLFLTVFLLLMKKFEVLLKVFIKKVTTLYVKVPFMFVIQGDIYF